jgi:hypothetical protein
LPTSDSTTKQSILWFGKRVKTVFLVDPANLNDDGPDSLEETLRSRNTPRSLPVFTVADIHRFDREPSYVFRTAMRLLDYFLDIDRVRGTGRLYVP